MTSLWDHSVQWVQWAVVVGAAMLGAFFDVATRRIPNRLTGPMLLGGLVWAVWVAGPGGLTDSIAGCLLLAIPYVLLFVFAGGGAGDAKLMAAIGAWLGVVNGLIALSAVSVSAVVLAFGYALSRKRVRLISVNLVRITCHAMFFLLSGGRIHQTPEHPCEAQEMQNMPYGVTIFVGISIAAGITLVWRI